MRNQQLNSNLAKQNKAKQNQKNVWKHKRDVSLWRLSPCLQRTKTKVCFSAELANSACLELWICMFDLSWMNTAVESVNSNQIPCIGLAIIFLAVLQTCHKYTKSSTETELSSKLSCWSDEWSVNYIESNISQYTLATFPLVYCQTVHFQQFRVWHGRFQHLAIH